MNIGTDGVTVLVGAMMLILLALACVGFGMLLRAAAEQRERDLVRRRQAHYDALVGLTRQRVLPYLKATDAKTIPAGVEWCLDSIDRANGAPRLVEEAEAVRLVQWAGTLPNQSESLGGVSSARAQSA